MGIVVILLVVMGTFLHSTGLYTEYTQDAAVPKKQSDNGLSSNERSCWCNECLTGGCDCTGLWQGV